MGKAGPYKAVTILASLLFTTFSPVISAQDEPVKIKPQRDESLMLEEVVELPSEAGWQLGCNNYLTYWTASMFAEQRLPP